MTKEKQITYTIKSLEGIGAEIPLIPIEFNVRGRVVNLDAEFDFDNSTYELNAKWAGEDVTDAAVAECAASIADLDTEVAQVIRDALLHECGFEGSPLMQAILLGGFDKYETFFSLGNVYVARMGEEIRIVRDMGEWVVDIKDLDSVPISKDEFDEIACRLRGHDNASASRALASFMDSGEFS